MLHLRLYNTLTRRLERFEPLKPDRVRLYTCGPTVYNFAHIGNMRGFLFYDVLRRVLEANQYPVLHVMNITDVGHLTDDGDEGEDRVELSAAKQKLSAALLVRSYTEAFLADIRGLNIEMPHVMPKATEHIPEQIALVQTLERKGYTYRTSDGIYFDTSRSAHYGELANLAGQQLQEGARVQKNPEKRNAADFALWKFSPKGAQRQMEWGSPWGTGFPGWHLECSTMAIKYLGETLDIHAGGIDHIPVHHTNEIAQSEAATGKPFGRFWLHNEFLVMDPLANLTLSHNRHQCPQCGTITEVKTEDGYERQKSADGNKTLDVRCRQCGTVFSSGMVKMAKSAGNFLTLTDLARRGYAPLAFRYLCLNTHYRKPLTFSWAALDGAQRAYQNLVDRVQSFPEPKVGCAEFEEKFLDAINDDLNTPKALGVTWAMLKSDYPDHAKHRSLLTFDRVLGLGLDTVEPLEIPVNVQRLVEQREDARAHKKFSEADALRQQIEVSGFSVEDTENGPVVKKR